jgi:hypothetical protein
MVGSTHPLFAEADVAYRRSRLMADARRTEVRAQLRHPRGPIRLRWPFRSRRPLRHQPPSGLGPMPSPHHAMSH